ncbi:MAG: tetratricopeptide repeat protein [Anaerolineae bacterium]
MNALSFGAWLKRRRRSLDLTQDALAARVVCSVETVRKLEAETLRPSKALAERLAECLDVPSEQRAHFVRFARGQADAEHLPVPTLTLDPARSPPTAPARPSSPPLPAPTTQLIGREDETRNVCHLLQQPHLRLVTLTGAGGVGKSRLALQVAAELQDHFADGVFFIPLAAIRDPSLVISAIAQTLGVRESGTRPLADLVVGWLRDKNLLLVLDNFEQVLDAAPLIADLLARCAYLKVLVTSRALLHLHGEQQYLVLPLALPPLLLNSQAELDEEIQVMNYPAAQLFVQRARLVKPEFALSQSNLQAIAEICHRLDGLPLALELAAARVRVLPPVALLQRLIPRLALLTDGPRDLPTRQRTMRAAIDWGYDLLEEEEKQLLRRLAVFVGGFTLEAAAAVAGQEGTESSTHISILDGLASLVDNSLIHQTETGDGEPRFSQLETVREYGLERLAESGELDAIRGRHARYWLALAQAAAPKLLATEQTLWFGRLEVEHNNLRAALQYLIDRNRAEEALQLAGALWRFWYVRGHFAEGRHWLELVLRYDQDTSAAARSLALYGAANLAFAQGDHPTMARYLEESLSLRREVGDVEGQGASLHALANLALVQGDYLKARDLAEEGLAIDRRLDNRSGMTLKLNTLGLALYRLGEYSAARGVLEENLVLLRAAGDQMGLTYAQNFIGLTCRAEGRYAEAQALHESSLRIQQMLGDEFGMPGTLHNLGIATAMLGEREEGERLCIESLRLTRKLGKKRDAGLVSVTLGYLTQYRGDIRSAFGHFQRAVAMFADLDDEFEGARALAGLAGVLWAYGHHELAAQVASAAETLLARASGRLDPRERSDFESSVAPIHVALTAGQLTDAWGAGRTLTLAAAAQATLHVAQTLSDVSLS